MNSPPYLLFFRRGKHMFLLSIYWTAAPLTKSLLRWWLKTFMESSMEYKWFIHLSVLIPPKYIVVAPTNQDWNEWPVLSMVEYFFTKSHRKHDIWKQSMNGIRNSRRKIKNVWPAACGAGATRRVTSPASSQHHQQNVVGVDGWFHNNRDLQLMG